jgi:Ion channel
MLGTAMRATVNRILTSIKIAVCWCVREEHRRWATLYLGGIPLFGLFYTFAIPDSFYAPYAQFDPDLGADRVALTATIQDAVARSYEKAFDQKYQEGVASGISSGLPSKENLVVDANTDVRPLAFTIRWLGPSPFSRGRVRYPWAIVTIVIKAIEQNPRAEHQLRLEVEQTPYRDARSDVRETGQRFFDTMFDGKKEYSLPLTSDEAYRIKRYLLGAQGRTDSFSYNILRMMYLSVVVQTTLGLGDLLPMTPGARATVGGQAIFGIIIAGFFLNAVAKRSR